MCKRSGGVCQSGKHRTSRREGDRGDNSIPSTKSLVEKIGGKSPEKMGKKQRVRVYRNAVKVRKGIRQGDAEAQN